MRPLACLLLAALLAVSMPAARAVTCDSFSTAAECQGKVTDSGRCGWTGNACAVVAPFEEEGMAAVTSIEEPTLSITSIGDEQPVVEAPALQQQQPAAPTCDDLPTPDNFTCAQQAAWGKCSEAWLVQGGFCRATCKLCVPAETRAAGAPSAEGPTSADFCAQPAEKGPCRAAVPSWFFNAASGACEPFLYGGCQGNANRFPDAATCEAAAAQYCTGRSDRLALQLASAGPADTSLTAGAAGSDQPTEAPAAGTETAAPAKSASPATHAGRSLFAWAALAAMFHLV